MSTPHNSAELGDIAKTVIMPGDPLRAKFIAENYLTDVVEVNSVRNCLGFTGYYKGIRVSVMASGMGIPSLGIYSYELYKFYGVENIIRAGSAGAYTADLNLFDIVIAKDAYSESSFAKTFDNIPGNIQKPAKELNQAIKKTAKKLGLKITEGRIHSSDVFYHEANSNYKEAVDKKRCLAVEMESFGLFAIANALGKHAACILTISDSLVTHVETTHEERQTSFKQMMELALETAIQL